ncbi:MAG: hypothetical protein SGPRY_000335 [Prymnesium sp.]
MPPQSSCDASSSAPPPNQCERCGARGSLYADRASALTLRGEVFYEAFHGEVDPSLVVHPRILLQRALAAYADRPLLGEIRSPGCVEWHSYAQCAEAAKAFARQLLRSCQPISSPALLLCAANSVGWLIADWGCALAGVPTIASDASSPPAASLRAARAAARLRGRVLRAVCVDPHALQLWHQVLGHGEGEEGEEGGDGGEVAVLSTAHASSWLAANATSPDPSPPFPQPPPPLPAGEGGDLITCLFSFGSTGEPKPLWFDAPLVWAAPLSSRPSRTAWQGGQPGGS